MSPGRATAGRCCWRTCISRGTYSEVYPEISQGLEGLAALVRQFSAPGGVPSHVSVQMPDSIHEGGELGYALAHVAEAAFDHPDLTVACVVLHLNGYKIFGPAVLGRAADADVIGLVAARFEPATDVTPIAVTALGVAAPTHDRAAAGPKSPRRRDQAEHQWSGPSALTPPEERRIAFGTTVTPWGRGPADGTGQIVTCEKGRDHERVIGTVAGSSK